MAEPAKRPARKRAPAKPKAEVVSGEVVPMPAVVSGAMGGRAGFKLGKPMRTPEGERVRWEYIVQLIRTGNYANVAAAAAGIEERTYYSYLKRGREVQAKLVAALGDDLELDEHTVDPPVHQGQPLVHANDWLCWRFTQAIQRADAESEAYAVTIVRKHMADNWQAAMTHLERRHPKRWKRHQQHDVAPVEAVAEDDELLGIEGADAVNDVLRSVAERQALPKPSDDDATSQS